MIDVDVEKGENIYIYFLYKDIDLQVFRSSGFHIFYLFFKYLIG